MFSDIELARELNRNFKRFMFNFWLPQMQYKGKIEIAAGSQISVGELAARNSLAVNRNFARLMLISLPIFNILERIVRSG